MNKKGFTLNELMIILAILAIVIAIGVATVSGLLGNTSKSADEAQSDLVTETIGNWVVEYENYKMKVRDGVEDLQEDITSSRVERIIKLCCTDLKDNSTFSKADFEKFESSCLTPMLYPKDSTMLRLIIGQYINGDIFTTQSTEFAFYYIPNRGTLLVNMFNASAEQIRDSFSEYTITSEDVIYKLDNTGDKTLSLIV